MQSEGFTRYRHWDFKATLPDKYPLLLHFPYYLLYSSQVVKQADLVMALYLCGDVFSPEQKLRDFIYYEAITSRDSSLSASGQAIVAAEVGYLDLAYQYLRETAFVDLQDLSGNTADGIHLAAMGGAWLVCVAGFGGMRDYGEQLRLAPKLPPALTGMTFRLTWRGVLLHVRIEPGEVTYEVVEGDELSFLHYEEELTVTGGKPVTRPIPPRPTDLPPVKQPYGRGAGVRGIVLEADSTGLTTPRPRQ